ncbi:MULTISPECIES: hypothetical protein [unclassified Enterococcus]|uniref:hypothetical protein n=1 Tax=unclassified Enterococcus TaxID=2608891 RepID=UPI0015555E2E|nr:MULTISPECIES: hypothetical protein [unclassified Enterococcus]MBS7577877.1 hypothetical protein [Enterococcus sp. MMGLQ5-2]MBS7585137.1 hypothetical protein [Enterococcus sp. MMGLQ5-1]NPD12993.1 hypothetical protein [Enterococcus sp. MMGLQ5-1]NPD37707.1 hypothetical protein [Enterococcus sp. MMGLQ5-2]
MVPFLIYWAGVLAGIGFFALTIFFTIFYLVKKENGNLWAFAFFDVLLAIILAIIVFIYRWNNGFDITQYSNLYFTVIISLVAMAIIQSIFGRTPKEA